MRVIRNIVLLGTVSVAALSLTACETMKKTGDAITSIDMPFYGDDDVKAQDGLVMAKTNGCPQVAVVEDLKSLTQFEVPSAPTPGEKISSVAMTGLDTNCTVTEKTVAVDISLRFDGYLGPQAAEWQSQSRNFAYPYFIAVTTPAGDILSKEVFAATIRYDAGETAITQQEKTRQVIPLREDSKPGQYEILVGFQLTEDELNYARMMASQPAPEDAAQTTAAPAYDMAPEAKATPVYPEVKAAPAPAVVATPIAPKPVKPVAATPVAAAPAAKPETVPAPVATPVAAQAPVTAPTTTQPAAAPVPSTTDGSMTAAPTSAEVVQESPKPVAETVTPAQTAPAPTDPAAQEPAPAPAPTAETAAPVGPSAIPAMVDPYAAPPTQVIRIKPDGSVEKKQ